MSLAAVRALIVAELHELHGGFLDAVARSVGLSSAGVQCLEVLRLVAKGFTNKQIAQQLVLSEKTVGHHVEHIYNKISVSTRAAAVFFSLEHDLI